MENAEKTNENNIKTILKLKRIYLIFFVVFIISLFTPYYLQSNGVLVLGFFLFFYPIAGIFFLIGILLILYSVILTNSFKLRKAALLGIIGCICQVYIFFFLIVVIFYFTPHIGFFLGYVIYIGFWVISIKLLKNKDLESEYRPQLEVQKEEEKIRRKIGSDHRICPVCKTPMPLSDKFCPECGRKI